MKNSPFLDTFEIPPTQEGILNGLTFAVKDTIDVTGYSPANGLPKWEETHPKASCHASVIDLLLNAGATCKGRVQSAELTFSIDGESELYGTPLNPKAPDRIPGGSSSGSASAVASSFVDFALGTDNAGSIRVPASYCGLFGMRPTPGVISTSGLIPFSPSFDTVGVFSKTASCLSKVMNTLLPTVNTPPLKTIYVLTDAFNLCDKEVADALMPAVNNLPGKVQEITLKELFGKDVPPLDIWYDEIIRHVQWPEIIHSVGKWLEEENPDLSPRISAAIKAARALDPSGLEKALNTIKAYKKALVPGSLLIFPTTPSIAPIKGTLNDKETSDKYYGRTLGLCGISTVTGAPEISIPLGSVHGVPVGLSLLAAPHCDHMLLDVISKLD